MIRVGDADIWSGICRDIGDYIGIDAGVVRIDSQSNMNIGVKLLKIFYSLLISGCLVFVRVTFAPENQFVIFRGIEAFRQRIAFCVLRALRYQVTVAAGEQQGGGKHQGKQLFHPLVPPLATPDMIFFRKIRNSTISGREITVTAAIMAGIFSRPKPFSRIS